jgi:hypothetical protein
MSTWYVLDGLTDTCDKAIYPTYVAIQWWNIKTHERM